MVSSEPKPQRREIRFTGRRDSDNSCRAASTLSRSDGTARRQPGCFGMVPAETAFAHPSLGGQHGKGEMVGEMGRDPGMERAEFVFRCLQGQGRAELRLPRPDA